MFVFSSCAFFCAIICGFVCVWVYGGWCVGEMVLVSVFYTKQKHSFTIKADYVRLAVCVCGVRTVLFVPAILIYVGVDFCYFIIFVLFVSDFASHIAK